ncbi:STE3-domain-containing protein [Peniophora sp. CONT]|nr:STE3-domain-containing protein [Peniophora sp. CONT]
MAAVDPTYPLYPVACIATAPMMLLVLFTSFIRQSWNLSVAFLCFWLFCENLTDGINAILWADNADVKSNVYCDIVSHLQIVTSTVKPMTTLMIIRRLYMITSLQSVELPNKAANRRNLAIEWTLGLMIPVLVAGPLYYAVRYSRYSLVEGHGCELDPDNSILAILLIQSWGVIPPLLSIAIYYPRVAWTLYRQSRDINRFLNSNNSVTRTNYIRILALASIDILLTLPIGIVSLALNVTGSLGVTSNVVIFYFGSWISPVLAFAIFGFFGLTSEARSSYWHAIYTVAAWCGWKPTPSPSRARSRLEGTESCERPQDAALDFEIGSKQNFFNTNAHEQEQGVEGEGEGAGPHADEACATSEEDGPDKRITEEPRQLLCNTVYAHSSMFMYG